MFISKTKMRNIFEIECLIYDLEVNIGYYLRIRLFYG